MYLYILHRTDYGSFSESSLWVGWLVIFRNGTESTWTMDCKALTKQPLCEMYKYIFKKYLICVGMQVDWSRQTVNLLPQGKLVGLNPTRHTKQYGVLV